MGAKQSIGTLSIVLDYCEDGIIFQGNEMKGKCFLDVIQEKSDIEMLEIEIIGEEIAVHTYSSERDGEGSGTTVCCENHQFFNLCCRRIPFIDGSLSCGSYAFPFVFSLPKKLPTSMIAASPTSRKDYCSVSYHVAGKIKNSKTKKWEICHTVPFTVRSSSSILHSYSAVMDCLQLPLYISPQIMKVKSFSCLEKGTMLLGLYSPSSVLSLPDEREGEGKGPGTSPSVDFEVSYLLRNNSSVLVKGLCFAIIEHVIWKPEETPIKKSITLFSKKVLEKDIIYYESSSFSSEEEAGRKMKVHLDTMKAVIQGSLSSSNSPSSSPHETFYGRLITIHHELVITVETSSFSVNNPTISTPIILVDRLGMLARRTDDGMSGTNVGFPTLSLPTLSLIDVSDNSDVFLSLSPVSSRSTQSGLTDNELVLAESDERGPTPKASHTNSNSIINNSFLPFAHLIHDQPPYSCHYALEDSVVAVAKSSSHSSCTHCCVTSINNFSKLLSQLKKSYFPLLDIQSWFLASSSFSIESLSPIDFQQLFLFVKHPLDQLSLLKLLMEYRSNSISVQHIHRCLDVCSKVIRVELVKEMIGKIISQDGNEDSSTVALLSPSTRQKRKVSSSFPPSLFTTFTSSSSCLSSLLSSFEWICIEEHSG
jgi:hypothetical protein